MKKLDGKISLITGGTSGIGLAAAELFRDEGSRVIVSGRGQAPEGLEFVRCDLTRLSEIQRMAAEVRERWGRLDVLFVNAGVCRFAPIEEVDERFFDDHFNTNVKGAYFTVRHLLPLMPEGSAILLNASIARRIGRPRISVYAATKAALWSFGQTLAAELAPRGIRVNTLSPGPVETPLFEKMKLDPEAAQALHNRMAGSTALKRYARPVEIARVALFLASEDASYMTGADVAVDGGVF